MRRAKVTALWLMLFLAVPLFIAGCSSSSSNGDGSQDQTPPTVTGQFPASGAVDVPRSGPFWIAFSEPMNQNLFPGSLSFAPGPVYYNTSWDGDTLVITPASLLAAGTLYQIAISGACQDTHGNTMGSDYPISFTTTSAADNTPPEVVMSDPASGATGVLGTKTIEITFSEPMNIGNAESAIELSPEPDAGWVEWEGLTMKIRHSAFPSNHLITVTINTGATDLAGNHLADAYVFSFRTLIDNTRPTLVSASPANNATGVSTSLSNIVLTFSEPMDQSSFNISTDFVDARINQIVRDEPTFNGDNSSLTVPISRRLLPGCTYWVKFLNVTDAAGNPIDPNPTSYQFTVAGTKTYYPVAADDVWNFVTPSDDEATRFIDNYNASSGTFDEVVVDGEGHIRDKTHLRKTPTQIQHLGRDEYHDGVYEFSMMWDQPLPYIKLPVDSYIGQSWDFSASSTIDESTSLSLSGHVDIEPTTVDLVSEALRGTFKGCCVHHLYVDLTMYVDGNPVDEAHVHQILWLAPGVGPVQMANVGEDTLRVFDWSL
jgi:hypothetical protein